MAVQGITMPPPSGGLNLVSPIDNMSPEDALELVNVYPGPGAPQLRKGYELYVTTGATINGPIRTSVSLPNASGGAQLIVATDTKLYTISSTKVVTDISKTGNYTNGEWQTVIYDNRLYLCNSSNNAQVYSGTPATPAADVTFTGVSLANLVNVTAYRERLYYVEKNSTRMWYGGFRTTGTAGTPALTSFDFSYVFKRGGFLVAVGSHSNTNNYSTQDYFWALSSEGEILFYQGSYAGAAADWTIVRADYIGKPLGYKAVIKSNADTWILTVQGIVSLSALMQSSVQVAQNAVSEKINPLISQYAKVTPFSSMWNGFFWPEGRRIYVNIPINANEQFFLVYNLDKGTWTKFELYDESHAISSCLHNGLPFYGSLAGVVWQGDTGYLDAVQSGVGQYINFNIRGAVSFYGSRGNFKAFKDIRPIIKSSKAVQITVAFHTDFRNTGTESVTQFKANFSTFTPWGSPWGSSWSSDVAYIFDRYAAAGQGHCASIAIKGSANNTPLEFLAFEVRFDLGGQV